MLKQPLQTSIAVDTLDFERFSVEEQLHIGISVRDFRAIAVHAESLRASVACCFSVPSQPMRLSYNELGVAAVFTLMTIGELRGAASQAPLPKPVSAPRQKSRPQSQKRPAPPTTAMPPPEKILRASPPRPRASVDAESLFVPQFDDEDRQWGERNLDEEDTVGWSASAPRVCSPMSALLHANSRVVLLNISPRRWTSIDLMSLTDCCPHNERHR